jgi:DnaK suppressor protein
MKPTTIDAAFRKLIERRRALLAQIPQLTEHERQEHEAEMNDWIDRAAGEESERVLHMLAEGERTELREIEAALARIAEHRFGTCESCGRGIGAKRIEAIPEARRCRDCADSRRAVG